MNCDVVQRRLLSARDPRVVPSDVRAHLAYCESCRDWHDRLGLMEQGVRQLPVPRSRRKGELLTALLHDEAPTATPAEMAPTVTDAVAATLPFPALHAPRPRPSRAAPRLAVGLAAAGVLLAVGWWVLREHEAAPDGRPAAPPPRNPLLASLLRRDLRLATAGSPAERLEILADVADDLQGTVRTLAREAGAESLDDLVRLYQQVVQDGIVRQAQAVPAAQRQRVVDPVADRLARTARLADRQADGADPAHAPFLHQLGTCAREGNRRLYALLNEGKS